jgi:hypothetical protein
VNRLKSMDSSKPSDLTVVETRLSPCCHLRSAGMYVFNDGSREEGAENDNCSSYWCSKTMKSFGPNDELVGGRECRDSARACYEPL